MAWHPQNATAGIMVNRCIMLHCLACLLTTPLLLYYTSACLHPSAAPFCMIGRLHSRAGTLCLQGYPAGLAFCSFLYFLLCCCLLRWPLPLCTLQELLRCVCGCHNIMSYAACRCSTKVSLNVHTSIIVCWVCAQLLQYQAA